MQGKMSVQGSAECQLTASLPIGSRIRELREQRGFTQGDVEQKTGLMRCYISRVENGFKVPSLETLEKFAAAFDLPLYRLFYSGSELPSMPRSTSRPSLQDFLQLSGKKGPEARFLRKLGSLWSHMGDLEHQVLFDIACGLAARADETVRQKCSTLRPGRKFRLLGRRFVPGRGEWHREEAQSVEASRTTSGPDHLKSLPRPILDRP
jgi:transcriptional regulator with XRE-family HTH domain